jgi:rod shape-determining protein MreD
MKKIIFLLFTFYFLILIQTSFLNFLRIQPNLILILFLILAIFEKEERFGLFGAFCGGFFLDIFSNLILGTTIITFLLIYFIIKIILDNFRKINFYTFSILIILGTLIFELLLPLNSYIFSKIFGSLNFLQFNFNYTLFLKLIYELILGIAGFYILKSYSYIRKN